MQYYVATESFIRPFLQFLFLFILFYWLGKTISTAILPWALSSFFALIAIILFLKKELKDKGNEISSGLRYKDVITFSLPVTLISIIYFLFAWTDLIILGFFRPAEKIGIYNGVARTAEMTNLFLLSINEVFSPLVSQLSYKRDFNSLGRIFKVIVRWSCYFSLPLYIFFIFSGKDFLGLVFGKDFIIGYIPMIILLSGLILQNFLGPVGMTLTMSGYQREWAFINFVGLLVNISLALLFIPKLGILGASLSTCLSIVILRSVGIVGVKKFLKFKTHDIKVIKPLLQGIITLFIIGYLVTKKDIRTWDPVEIFKKIDFLRLRDKIISRWLKEKIKDKLETSFIGGIDFENSLVYPGSQSSQGVFINKKQNYNEIKENLIKDLKNLKNPLNSENILNGVYAKKEIYSGPFIDNLPDIVFNLNKNYKLVLKFTSHKIIEEAPFEEGGGHHSPYGIYAFFGKNLKTKGKHQNKKIYDIVPTILYYLDIPIPEYMDGKVIEEIFDLDHKPKYVKKELKRNIERFLFGGGKKRSNGKVKKFRIH